MDKSQLDGIPSEGEFVRWLHDTGKTFEEYPLYKTKEYGLIEDYNAAAVKLNCRPFNRITVEDGCIVKEAVDDQGRRLAAREAAWYKKLEGKNFANIPRIYGTSPLRMERIDGKNIYEYNLTPGEKSGILGQLIECIRSIHKLETVQSDYESYYEAYIGKTFKRLEKVRRLVPFADDEYITVNGIRCRNVFGREKELEAAAAQYMPKSFCLIHGDCTFSNMLLKNDCTPVMIDPRGYFGFTEYYGDPAYDWVKLYYSIAGNYDQFNMKRFSLDIGDNGAALKIDSNHWEDMEDRFFKLLEGEVTRKQMKLLHAITWLSLTTYAWDDYDSICGAFYNGLLILSDAEAVPDLN